MTTWQCRLCLEEEEGVFCRQARSENCGEKRILNDFDRDVVLGHGLLDFYPPGRSEQYIQELLRKARKSPVYWAHRFKREMEEIVE